MVANQIFKDELKKHTISRLENLSTTPDGLQAENRTSLEVTIAVYNQGTKLIQKQKEDSYTVSILTIYSDLKVLNILDEITIDNLVYKVLENRDYTDYSVYKAVANV